MSNSNIILTLQWWFLAKEWDVRWYLKFALGVFLSSAQCPSLSRCSFWVHYWTVFSLESQPTGSLPEQLGRERRRGETKGGGAERNKWFPHGWMLTLVNSSPRRHIGRVSISFEYHLPALSTLALQCGLNPRLPDGVSKNAGCSVKFEFQIKK